MYYKMAPTELVTTNHYQCVIQVFTSFCALKLIER